MVQITKGEAKMLQDKGFRWGSDLHKTYSRNPHYYATTSAKLMKQLDRYREEHIVRKAE